jgi:plasmid replication initiation protein
MPQLHQKSGSTRRVTDFAKDVRKVVDRQRLPGYWLDLYRTEDGEEALRFTARSVLAIDHPGYEAKPFPRFRIAAQREPAGAPDA